MSCLLGVAFAGITCGSFDLVDERLKVCIDDVRDFELVLVILEQLSLLGWRNVQYLDSWVCVNCSRRSCRLYPCRQLACAEEPTMSILALIVE